MSNSLKTNVPNIKTVAKILAKELRSMQFAISHSSALNLASRSLGYKNYQTYKALDSIQNRVSSKESNTQLSFADIEKEISQKTIFPPANNHLIPFGQFSLYDIFICEEDDVYFLLFSLKNNYSGRVFYTPEYETFSFYVYPNIETAKSSYDIPLKSVSGRDLNERYFEIIKHIVNTKKWSLNTYIMNDLLSLMEALKNDRDSLSQINSKYSREELATIYQSKDLGKL